MAVKFVFARVNNPLFLFLYLLRNNVFVRVGKTESQYEKRKDWTNDKMYASNKLCIAQNLARFS